MPNLEKKVIQKITNFTLLTQKVLLKGGLCWLHNLKCIKYSKTSTEKKNKISQNSLYLTCFSLYLGDLVTCTEGREIYSQHSGDLA